MKGLILLIIAIALAVVILPIGFGYQIITSLFNCINEYLFKTAKSIDQLANVICQNLFNDVLIKKNGYKFGNEDKTISHVLGKNEQTGTLSITGKALAWLLNTIDNNHNQESIENKL
tara:strand:+ start:151 stop:501 length:351 start_codon:yes stop_codon:yes gene_type:complete